MNYFKYLILRIEEKMMKVNHCMKFYYTSHGIKNFGANKLVGFKQYYNHALIELLPEDLYLGPDFLKNDYTLLGCPLKESPHYWLMKAIIEDMPLNETDYFIRYTNGCLDWRSGKPMPNDFSFYYSKFNTSKKDIMDGNYRPVITYKQKGKYYIFDGKHRSSMCALLRLPIKCVVVGSEIANADIWHYMFSMVNNDTSYSQHTAFHDDYLESLKSQL